MAQPPDEESAPLKGEEVAAEVAIAAGAVPTASGQSTAKAAAALLVASHGFEQPDGVKRRNIARAFAGAGKVVYGKASTC